MLALLYLAGWIGVGVLVLALAAWTRPDVYDDTKIDRWKMSNAAGRAFLTVMFWPGALITAVALVIADVVIRSKRENLRIRAELEKELAAARREIDAFVKAGR